jgi:hypothetical protein
MPDPQSVAYNGYATAPTEVPTANEKLFKGWYTTGECTTAFNFNGTRITAATTIYAKWVAAYTVTYHLPQAVPNMFDVPTMLSGWTTNVDGIWIVPPANESFNASAMSSYWDNYVDSHDHDWQLSGRSDTQRGYVESWRIADEFQHAASFGMPGEFGSPYYQAAYIRLDNGKVANANNRYFTVRFEAGQRPTRFTIGFWEVYPFSIGVTYPTWYMGLDCLHSARWKLGSPAGPEFDFNTTPIPAEGVHLYLDLDMSRWDHFYNADGPPG